MNHISCYYIKYPFSLTIFASSFVSLANSLIHFRHFTTSILGLRPVLRSSAQLQITVYRRAQLRMKIHRADRLPTIKHRSPVYERRRCTLSLQFCGPTADGRLGIVNASVYCRRARHVVSSFNAASSLIATDLNENPTQCARADI